MSVTIISFAIYWIGKLTARGLLFVLRVWLDVGGFGLLLFELLVGREGLGGG